jgi:hypothetical protein
MPVEYNKGNIAEAIVASAIVARFKKRFKSSDFNGKNESVKIGNLPLVSIQDIKEVLGQVVRGPSSFNVRDFDRKTKKEVDITDNISVSVSIPQKDLQFLQRPDNWNKITSIFNAAISKVNADSKLKGQAYGLSVNKKYDTINVSAQGTLDQKGTKVDISVSISSVSPKTGQSAPAPKGSKISLKYDAPQFAQAVGLEFENFGKIFDELELNNYNLFSSMFESEVKSVYPDILGKKFDDRNAIKNSNEVKALKKVAKKVFESVTSQLNKKLIDRSFKEKLAKYCINKATLNESGVELVKFTSSGSSKTQSFGPQFITNVSNSELEATFVGSGSDPKIIVYLRGEAASKANTLIQFRYRTDAGAKDRNNKQKIVMRSYVESGDLLYKL